MKRAHYIFKNVRMHSTETKYQYIFLDALYKPMRAVTLTPEQATQIADNNHLRSVSAMEVYRKGGFDGERA